MPYINYKEYATILESISEKPIFNRALAYARLGKPTAIKFCYFCESETEHVKCNNRHSAYNGTFKESVPTPLRMDVRQEVRAEREADKKEKRKAPITPRQLPLMFYMNQLKETDSDYPYSDIDAEYWTNTKLITAHQHYFDDDNNYQGTRIFTAFGNPTYLDSQNGVEYAKRGMATSKKQQITNPDTLKSIQAFWQDVFICSDECTEADMQKEREKARLRKMYPTAADEMIKLLKLGI